MNIEFYFRTEELQNELLDEGYGCVIHSPFLQRLKGISYLATMDHIYNVKHRFTRYDHVIGVAYLALCLARKLNFADHQKDVLVLANLIHDVGHSAFSHAGEIFLLERQGRYHGGILNNFLRLNQAVFPGEPGLKDLLSEFSDDVQSCVNELILEQRCKDDLVNSVYNCAINCDRVEGTNRTFLSLGLDFFCPLTMIDAFTRVANRVFVKDVCIQTFVDFWKGTEKLYNDFIYTFEVSSAEAMLTRALEVAYQDRESLRVFLSHTDPDVYEALNHHPVSRDIISSFLSGYYYSPLSQKIPDLFSSHKSDLTTYRFDYVSRRKIERKISNQINIEPDFVISHFSYRKRYFLDLLPLYQLSFFGDPSLISIENINRAFSKRNISGDFFEVFVR